jgi:hypothetical protein
MKNEVWPERLKIIGANCRKHLKMFNTLEVLGLSVKLTLREKTRAYMVRTRVP